MPGSWSQRAWVNTGCGALILGGFLAHAWHFRAYINDDAYITFRYSLNLAAGRGPYFNAGEHVEGYTNFLLMVVLAGVSRAAGPDSVPTAARFIGVLGGVTALVAAYALCRRWLRRVGSAAPHAALFAWLAPALVAVNGAYALNSVSGLETTLFSGFIMLAAWLAQRAADTGRWHAAGVAAALAALTRPEGLLVGVGLVGGGFAHWLTDVKARRARVAPRGILADAIVVGVAVLGHLGLRAWLYDGELVPNTYYAKMGGFSAFTAAHRYIGEFAARHLGGPVAVAALLPLLARDTGVRRAVLPALCVLALALAGVFATGSDWMLGYRLLVPFVPLWAALSVCGIAGVAARFARTTVVGTSGFMVLVAACLWCGRFAEDYHATITLSAHGYKTGHVALARWLHDNAAAGDTVALMDIGLVGYGNPQLRILDLTGLTDRHIAKSPGGFVDKHYDPAYVLDQRPRYIVITMTGFRAASGEFRYNPWTGVEARLAEHPRFARDYRRLRARPLTEDPCESWAALFGAERVFQHDDRRKLYLLTVYERRPEGAWE
jgi:hypothetical protein